MTMKRNAECSLSERAIAFSVDALLSGGGKSKTPRIDHEDMPDSQEYECRNKAESEYSLKSDCVFPFEEKRSDIQVELQSADLWSRFYRLGNEMIITKSGRRIFPALKVKVKGLEPKSHYIMWADILPVDNLRYRYVYHTSQWVVAGAGEEPAIRPSVYIHPDSPALGRQWQSQVVTFDKLKLTNNKNTVSKGQVILHSMHKYLPRIHIQKTVLPDSDPEHQIDALQSVTFSFPETEFITVTAYQNQQITRLKIASNPFAKGFREVLRTGKKGPVNAADRQKLEAVNSFSRNSSNSGITDFSSTHGIPYTGNMNIDFNHQSAFFPASTSLYRLGTSPFHYSHENLRTTYSQFPFSHDNLRTTYTHFPFSPCYDVRQLSPTVGACDTYHHNEQSLFHKVSNSGTVSVRDSCTFRSDSQAESTTNLIFGWRPNREETKPTARVAPCVLHDTHSHIYSQLSSTASLQKGT